MAPLGKSLMREDQLIIAASNLTLPEKIYGRLALFQDLLNLYVPFREFWGGEISDNILWKLKLNFWPIQIRGGGGTDFTIGQYCGENYVFSIFLL